MSKRSGLIAILVVIGAAFVSIMAWGMVAKEPVTGRSGITRVGRPAPEFTIPLFEGGEFALGDSLGQPVVVNFWASWCSACRKEAPVLEKTWRAYKDRDVLFVGVNIQDREEDALAFIREFNKTYLNGPDTTGKITIEYGVVGIPVTYFVNRDGVIVRRFVGANDEARLVRWVEELLAGTLPTDEPVGSNPEGYSELDRGSD